MELRQHALTIFAIADPRAKTQAALALFAIAHESPIDPTCQLHCAQGPGRPRHPLLVQPHEVAKRSPYTPQGHAALMHSIAHIEFNAIDLALDCVWRFPDMPETFYRDWARIAAEEARHFSLLVDHLDTLGYAYGDFAAHTGLWTVCANTAHDIVARMALVPRTMEARGLDATPLIQAKLSKVGSPAALQAIDVLQVILDEEVGHVAAGNRWYRWLCQQRGLDADAFYAHAAQVHAAPRPRPPFNYAARLAAGFTPAEMAQLASATTSTCASALPPL